MDFGGDDLLRRVDVLRQGATDADIRSAIAGGEIGAVCRGVYAHADLLTRLTPAQRHRLDVQAAAIDAETGTAASHQSAAMVHGLAMYGPDLSKVHVSTPQLSGGYVTSRRHVHAAGLEPVDVTVVGGVPVTTASRTIADLARTSTFEKAVCVGDSALHLGLTTSEQLTEALTRTVSGRKRGQATRVLGFLDGRAESVGESRSRVYLAKWGVPSPELQVTLTDEDGEVLGRPDFLWEDAALIGEFDGLSKYSKHGRPGETPADVVAREKRREDLLRAHGWMVLRWTWKELGSRAVADRIMRELAVPRRRPSTGRRAVS